MIGILGEVLLGRIVLGGDVDRDAVAGEVELAGQERLVVRGIVPRCHARNEGLRQRLAILERLGGLRRVDDDLVVLVDRITAVRP